MSEITDPAPRGGPVLIEMHESIEPLATEWDALVDRAGAPPWLRPGWIDAWWAAFGQGGLQLVAVRREEVLVALAPLCGTPAALRTPANWESPGYGLLAEDQAAADELAHALLVTEPRSVFLSFVEPADPVSLAAVAAARSAGYRLLQRHAERSPFLELVADWPAFESGLDAKLKRDLRRRERRLEESGVIAIEVRDGREDLDQLLDEGFRIEAAAWKGERGTAISSDATTGRFYREIACWAAARGSLRLAFLRLDGRPLAFDLSLEEGGVHYLLKTGYDDTFARFAPAKLLRRHMLERSFAQGLVRYEFLGDQDAWKLEWTSSTRERVLLQAFRDTFRGRLEWAANAYGRPLVRRLLSRRRG